MRCPVCKADNSAEVATCRRCKADLSLLVALERSRAALVAQTQQRLATGDGPTARPLAVAVDGLRRDAESSRLLALSHLLLGDYASARAVYSSARSVKHST